ncbi:MAG: LuxR C-terminal-related transcriptional regulator [Alkalispirochaeta sp.]
MSWDDQQLRNLFTVQRDMLVHLGSVDTAADAAAIALDATGRLSGIECGAIYLRSDSGRGTWLEMASSFGISHGDAIELVRIPLDQPLFRRLVSHPEPYYDRFVEILQRSGGMRYMSAKLDKLRGAAIVPIVSEGDLVGSLQVASCSYDEIPELTRDFLEQLSSWLGDMLAKKFYQQELEAAEHALREQAEALTEANTALKVILRTQQEEQDARFEALRTRFASRVRPVLTRLERFIPDGRDGGLLDVLKLELESIFGVSRGSTLHEKALSRLTPREAQVLALIRSDYSTKEIAARLSISTDAVAFHRKRIRAKLGITGTGKNLRQFISAEEG